MLKKQNLILFSTAVGSSVQYDCEKHRLDRLDCTVVGYIFKSSQCRGNIK